MLMLWLLAGCTTGTLNGLSLIWSVGRLRPGVHAGSVALVMLGTLLRWGLAAGLLAFALQRGIGPGLASFAGLWLARWITVAVALSPRHRVPFDLQRN